MKTASTARQRGLDEVAGAAQLRLARAERLVVAVAALEAGDAHVGVALEQAHELAAGDAGGADDAHADGGAAADGGLAEARVVVWVMVARRYRARLAVERPTPDGRSRLCHSWRAP